MLYFNLLIFHSLILNYVLIDFNYKNYGGSSQYNFGILAKIIKHMKVSSCFVYFKYALYINSALVIFINFLFMVAKTSEW